MTWLWENKPSKKVVETVKDFIRIMGGGSVIVDTASGHSMMVCTSRDVAQRMIDKGEVVITPRELSVLMTAVEEGISSQDQLDNLAEFKEVFPDVKLIGISKDEDDGE